ncbi:hypothetical protein [Myroides injenensis]|uniref:hypothetical protein n=1 Tax=Myroides injenensis TaxID=1183151 RepID=UPI0002884472|nr:hypothetical protein [Myroides injenensis]
MAKNSLFNIGKNILNELKDKLIEQNKETISTSANELLTKNKEIILGVANDKVNEISKGKVKVDLNQIFNNSNEEKGNLKINESPISKGEVLLPEEDDAKYKNADQFEKNLHQSLNTLAVSAARNPTEAALVLKDLVNKASEVSKFTEVQKTKRKEIEAQRDKYISKINAQKEVMLAYLDKTFDERKGNFEKLFQIVDHALATNNIQVLAMGLDNINQLAASSPFKDLSSIESTQKALEDKDHIWDI